MPLFFKSETRKAAERFRTIAYTAAAESDLTQTEIASHAGIEQNTWSSWLNPHTDKNIPAFIVPLLPKTIRDQLLDYLCERSNGSFVPNLPLLKALDGSIDDEIKDIVVIEGKIIGAAETDPEKARREVAQLEAVVRRLKAEISKMAEASQ